METNKGLFLSSLCWKEYLSIYLRRTRVRLGKDICEYFMLIRFRSKKGRRLRRRTRGWRYRQRVRGSNPTSPHQNKHKMSFKPVEMLLQPKLYLSGRITRHIIWICEQKAKNDGKRKGSPSEGVSRRRAGIAASCYDQATSKRSRFITLFHAATKSFRNFSCESSQA